jgi:hypothetical protein
MTGDADWHGRWESLNPSLAAATTTTLPNIIVNALNKVLHQYYDGMESYRWYEPIVSAMPHDGSTQDVQMISLSGITALPVVPEGTAYTEKDVSDRKVSAAFSKYGAYVGITLEMLRKNDIVQMVWLPRELMNAAIRTRSAAVASLFTMNSGTGPTMSYDSTALFHSNHGNVDTTAFSYAAWGAARTAMAKQTYLGSGHRIGLLPRYCLVPVDLYDSALNIFGSGVGYGGLPGSPNNDLNVYAEGRPNDPRPTIIWVPDWTDATDWAFMADPGQIPSIQMAYANLPGGGKHPSPEIFTAAGETVGINFSHDTLPIKIRDWWSLGVSTHLGIGKRNVA